MKAIEDLGYSKEECRIINLVRIHQQVLFESDIFEADGQKLDSSYLSKRPRGEKWSTVLFPSTKVQPNHFTLWQSALQQLAPGGRRPRRLGKMTHESHKIWPWRLLDNHGALVRQMGDNVDVYKLCNTNGRRSRNKLYELDETIEDAQIQGRICSVTLDDRSRAKISSITNPPPSVDDPSNFLDVLKEWGHTWIWHDLQISNGSGKGVNLRLQGTDEWIYSAIQNGTLIAVSDGSYIREWHPELCSAAMIMECQQSKNRIVVPMAEHCLQANAYRGELIGLMAIHLLLLSFNRVRPDLTGSVHIYSDCLGALHKVEHLPPRRIPSRCRHSDVLKTIMLNCSDLTFKRLFSHVKAHQEDSEEWSKLERESQLNCGCDLAAKDQLLGIDLSDIPRQKQFPLEAAALFVGGHKVTTDSGPVIRYEAQMKEARAVFHERKVLMGEAFDEVAWKDVHRTLHSVPKMFQIFACKQVFDVSATFDNLKKRNKENNPSALCPSCGICKEKGAHILLCPEEGRVEALGKLSHRLAVNMVELGTDRDLVFLMLQYIRCRGTMSMEDICRERSLPEAFLPFARSQDTIGWRRFLEGMVSKRLPDLARDLDAEGDIPNIAKWMESLITNLLEVTHGMWIYRNVVVHDELEGVYAVQGRERLQRAIEEQQELGDEGLGEEDKWLLEVNLADLDSTSGEREAYWVLAVEMARKKFEIRQRDRVTASSAIDTNEEG
eukprot:scaffold70426_cov59-Cyclotella_meneghiniana.AAC.2